MVLQTCNDNDNCTILCVPTIIIYIQGHFLILSIWLIIGYFEDPGYYHGPPQPAHVAPAHVASHGGAPHEDPNLIGYPPIRHPHGSRGGFTAAPGNGIVMSGPPASRHSVRMRGLPYSAKEKDIGEFFSPLTPVKISVDLDQYGRPSGEAEVYFSKHDDAVSAMQKNNQNIGEL